MDDTDLIPSKVLAVLLRPDFWLWVGLLSAFWTSWRGWRKTSLGIITSLVAAVTLVGFVPVGSVWLGPLEAHFPANAVLENPPSVIIVLGGGEDTAPSAAWGTTNLNAAGDRFLQAIIRANQFPSAPVLLTGGTFDPTGDPLLVGGAERVATMLRAAGLAAQRVYVADGARTTAEHPADIRHLLETLHLTPTDNAPLLVITSAFHMPRAIGVLCAAGVGPLIADPTDFRTAPGQNWAHAIRWNYAGNLAALQLGIREWAGLLAYQRSGRINTLLPEGC